MEPLYEVVEKLGAAFELESDPAASASAAFALEVTHKSLHKLLKPDESAEGKAVAIARQDNPAANLNVQSIVIHPLQRPGAPGIDQAPPSKPVAAGASESDPHASKGGQE